MEKHTNITKAFLFAFFALILYFVFEYQSNLMFSDELVVRSKDSSLFVMALLACSLIYFLVNNFKSNHILFRSFSVQMLTMYAFALLMSMYHPFPARITNFTIILPLVLFWFMYCITYKLEDIRLELVFFLVLSLALTAYFFATYKDNILYDITRQNNAAYAALFYLPFVLCFKNKLIKIVVSLLFFLAIVFSLKRGGFFAFFAGIFAYLYVMYYVLGNHKVKIWELLIIVLVIFGPYYLFQMSDFAPGELMLARFDDMAESGGSGRLYIYMNKLKIIGNSGTLGLIFGHGWMATGNEGMIGVTAHNDFLEMFYDFGIIGFSLFIWVWVSLIRLCKELIIEKSRYAAPMAASLAILFVNNCVAHIWIYSNYLATFAMFWGFVLAAKELNYFKINKI